MTEVRGWRDRDKARKGSQTKKSRKSLIVRTGKETNSHHELPEWTSPADMSTSETDFRFLASRTV